jgi:hypothetical protein
MTLGAVPAEARYPQQCADLSKKSAGQSVPQCLRTASVVEPLEVPERNIDRVYPRKAPRAFSLLQDLLESSERRYLRSRAHVLDPVSISLLIVDTSQY